MSLNWGCPFAPATGLLGHTECQRVNSTVLKLYESCMLCTNANGIQSLCFYERGSKISALGISGRIQTAHDRLVKRACRHLAICRCLPVTGWLWLEYTANTGKRQAGFLTTVRRGLENMLDGYMGDIFGSSRRGAGDLWTPGPVQPCCREVELRTCWHTSWDPALHAATEGCRRGDTKKGRLLRIGDRAAVPRLHARTVLRGWNSDESTCFWARPFCTESCRNICNHDKMSCYTTNFLHYRRSQLQVSLWLCPPLLRYHNIVTS